MIFKAFFDTRSETYTYLLAKSKGSEALIIDPVLENVDEYLEFLGNNQLKLVVAMDTHIHADHKTGLGKLRNITRCMTCLSHNSEVSTISRKLSDGDLVSIDGIELKVIETPGHTNDSCCFYAQGMVFTGDTLFIRGNGRTDFQQGNAGQLYDSIKDKLFTLPDDTMVWPAHDYKGEQTSTIGKEKIENPRYFGKSREEFIQIMDNLDLPNPKLMDIVLPFNQNISEGLGRKLDEEVELSREQVRKLKEHILIDLREEHEIEKEGTLEGSFCLPLRHLDNAIKDLEHPINLAEEVVFFCAYGERSAIALEMAKEVGFANCKHLKGGINAWKTEGFPTV